MVGTRSPTGQTSRYLNEHENEANGVSPTNEANGASPDPTRSRRGHQSFGTFAVQCNKCFKWRLVPSKEQYERIRAKSTGEPFTCANARDWRPAISCDDASDIAHNDWRWAIDKPDIAETPRGWERVVKIRAEGGTKFADVFYDAPSGKRLRSIVEVEKYLKEHENEANGVSLDHFSFKTPKPLQEDYVRKRPARSSGLTGTALETPQQSEAAEVIFYHFF